MKYNKRYSILIFATTEDCLIYDDVERHTVNGILFPDKVAAIQYLKGTLKQRPSKVKQ